MAQADSNKASSATGRARPVCFHLPIQAKPDMIHPFHPSNQHGDHPGRMRQSCNNQNTKTVHGSPKRQCHGSAKTKKWQGWGIGPGRWG
jgi:hypothetical protein